MAPSRAIQNLRKFDRFEIALPASLLAVDFYGGTLVSIGAGGCAIRTTLRLMTGQRYLVGLQIVENDVSEIYQIPAEVVWGCNDFRIDSFYRHGLHFLTPLDEQILAAILDTEKEALHLRNPQLLKMDKTI